MRNGIIHPAFNPESTNKRQRSAIGIVSSTKDIVFVMSDRGDRSKGRVTFHQLSRFFLHLGCQDALFLDGDISQLITSPIPDAKFTPHTFGYVCCDGLSLEGGKFEKLLANQHLLLIPTFRCTTS